MNIQTTSQTGAQSGQPPNPSSDSAGAGGNQQFNAELGGATRGSGPGGLPRTGGSSTSLEFSAIAASAQAQAQRDALGQARDNSDRGGGLARGDPAAPSGNVRNPQEQQAAILQEQLHAFRARGIHIRALPALRQLQARLAQAMHELDRRAASKALYHLSILVETSRKAHGRLPESLLEDVRMLVDGCLSMFRDALSNPQGRLSIVSLLRLDDFTLAYLRRATNLHSLGLKLDLGAASAAAQIRVEALSRQVVVHMADLIRMLAAEEVNLLELMRQLRDLSGMELQRFQQLKDLGEFVGGGLSPSERRAMAQDMCKLALMELSRTTDQIPIMHNAMRHMKLLLGLEGLFGKLALGLWNILEPGGFRGGGRDIIKLVAVTRYLLAGMFSEMDEQLSDMVTAKMPPGADIILYDDLVNRLNPSPAVTSLLNEMTAQRPDVSVNESVEMFMVRYRALMNQQANLDPVERARSIALHRALREQYGVVYDSTSGTVAMVVTDSARATMLPALVALALTCPHLTRTFTLPVNGEDKVFTVGQAFHQAALEGGIRLSVRGVDEQGRPVRYTCPAEVSEQDRPVAMGAALDALARIAPLAAAPLTRLMDFWEISRAVREGLQRMGWESPFRLDDGTVVLPEGEGWLALDVAQHEDGSFHLATTLGIDGIRGFKGVRPGGAAVIVNMNPNTASRVEVHFTMRVSQNGQSIDTVGLPQFRHCFDVKDMVADPTRLYMAQAAPFAGAGV